MTRAIWLLLDALALALGLGAVVLRVLASGDDEIGTGGLAWIAFGSAVALGPCAAVLFFRAGGEGLLAASIERAKWIHPPFRSLYEYLEDNPIPQMLLMSAFFGWVLFFTGLAGLTAVNNRLAGDWFDTPCEARLLKRQQHHDFVHLTCPLPGRAPVEGDLTIDPLPAAGPWSYSACLRPARVWGWFIDPERSHLQTRSR
jgi:hypothetical protein